MNNAERGFLIQVALGVFSIDSKGRIWRHGRMIGGSRAGAPSYMRMHEKPTRAERSEKKGYPTVMFSVDQIRMVAPAHRVVWMVTNHSDIPQGMEINHKDGVKANHHPSNLEVITRSENTIHACRVLGRKPKAQNGEANASAKLTEKSVLEIRAMCRNQSMAQSQIAKRYGIKQATISAIHKRKSWAHLS